MRRLGRIGRISVVMTAVLTAVVGLPAPAVAAGEINVPDVTVQVSAEGSLSTSQKITTSARGYSPKVTIEAGAARRVREVRITPLAGAVGSACSGGGGTWTCGASLDPTGHIQIFYGRLYSDGPLDLGTFRVAVSMMDNGQTYSGAGSVTVTTSAELEMLTASLKSLAGVGRATVQVRNNGVIPSPVTITVSGFGAVAVDDQGYNCSRSGTSLSCKATVAVGGTYLLQLGMPGSDWHSLRLVATVAGPYPDPKTGNNTATFGPNDSAPVVIPPGGSTRTPASGSSGKASPTTQPAVTGSASAVGAFSPSVEASNDPTLSAALATPGSVAVASVGAARDDTRALVVAVVAVIMVAMGLGSLFLVRRRRGRSIDQLGESLIPQVGGGAQRTDDGPGAAGG